MTTRIDKLKIINLRYGSLDNFDNVVASYYSIGKKINMSQCTVRFVCLKFVAYDHDLKRLVNKPKRVFQKIPDNVQLFLLDPSVLDLWAPYSIMERNELLYNAMGLRISHQTLWDFYKANGVKFRTGISVYRSEKTRSKEIRAKRIAFAQLLGNLVRMDKPLIWQDETTYHSWMQKTKSWSLDSHPILHARNNKRLATTVYGAFGNCISKGVFVLGKSTNQQEFCDFLLEVKAAVKPQYMNEKPILLYDQARAHTAKKA